MVTNLPCFYLTKKDTLPEFKQGYVETHLLSHVYSALLLIVGICAHTFHWNWKTKQKIIHNVLKPLFTTAMPFQQFYKYGPSLSTQFCFKNVMQSLSLLFVKGKGSFSLLQIPKSRRNFPYPQNERYYVNLEEDDAWVTTAYFIDPGSIHTIMFKSCPTMENSS